MILKRPFFEQEDTTMRPDGNNVDSDVESLKAV